MSSEISNYSSALGHIPRQSIVDRSTYFRVGNSESKRQQYVETEAVQDFRHGERLVGVHSELQHVFRASEVNNSVTKENAIHKHKQAIQCVHEEMRRTSIDQRVKRELSRATEFERKRRISIVEDALENPCSETCKNMQATNNRLIEVHQSLKEIFKRRESIKAAKEREVRIGVEESKEMLLQQLRRRSAYTSLKDDIENEHVQQIRDFHERYQNEDFCRTDQQLMDVQEEMIKLYRKNEGMRQEKERQQMENAKQRKSIVEEELVRHFNRKCAKTMSNIEWGSVRRSNTDSMALARGQGRQIKKNKKTAVGFRKLQAIHSALILRTIVRNKTKE
ncbi:UPF0430 protein CG31712-like [Clytia hemisphaerica]|uniref:Uncharacterized protein n=1 Tax=Clytia hemisphaerica TaxID=252671 RepID=A0A7M5XE68_9CNID|eukprot:TCONS_00064170-protein